MNKIDVNVKFLHPVWEENELAYATDHSAGLDLRACLDVEEIEIGPGRKAAIPAGLAVECVQPGVAGFVFSRSGLGTKEGLTVSQGVGVIDPDYRGEIKVSLLNTSGEVRRIRRGQRIAQLVFMPIFQATITPVGELGETARGAGGFGSTGKH
ncbi:MAG: dUTP diphosphatase [Pseudodesulfovibrio sp.]|jgi:dUTP pyrophosphatase|uniref:dUTP diphosphatase n=1 Tax=Pseudodesulfovibrio indicus TaxID=1716143 RepID=A0A126QPV7_9BACT|nr:dUTP diphosphatase [Pseudodesulfovibrio indicus]AMK11766.1 deoxyuridine 5'-triphosphate nucleotidohydrolase [Pseudodesulfovibrio indicus]TDT88303.1 deoxyuridine 5'-triphosphate nucleotidohydrolase [Pseudodesulfovibrio indicus]